LKKVVFCAGVSTFFVERRKAFSGQRVAYKHRNEGEEEIRESGGSPQDASRRTSGKQSTGRRPWRPKGTYGGYQEFIKCVKKGQWRYYINKRSKIFKNVQKLTKTV
jgi:hypothetical protein